MELMTMQWLQQFHTSWGDLFFRHMDFFDRAEFYILLFPFIWYGFSRSWGIRLFFWLMASAIGNYYFKLFFGQPRPFDLDPSLALLTAKNFGFPSGAAQGSLFLIAAFIQAKRSFTAWFSGIAFLALVCLSRIYLGVHFPSDIVGGLAIGSALFFLFWKFAARIEKWVARKAAWQQLLLLTAGTYFAYLPAQVLSIAQPCIAIFSVGCGLILSRLCHIPLSSPSLIKGFLAVASVIGLSSLASSMAGPIVVTAVLGAWLSFGIPCLLSSVRSMKFLSSRLSGLCL